MYSTRLPWSSPVNKLSRLLREKRDVLDLTESNPTRAGIAYDEAAILEALSDRRSLR